jgi:ribonuclease J
MNPNPTQEQLWFLPLGGTGEIGMNLNLYGHAGEWLMVDCGLTFNAPINPAFDKDERVTRHPLVSADPTFIEDRKDALQGIIITHAHEDHVGAIPYLWQRFKKPIYTTAFTAEVLKRKLSETDFAEEVPIVIVDHKAHFSIGAFECEWLGITHSIPEPYGLVIRTPAGSVFHTGDWKIDQQPVVDSVMNVDHFKQLGNLDITAMVCDSTNALKSGFSISESQCEIGLYHYVNSAPKRVVVSCFGSNIARLITLARIAARTGRYMALYGRSLKNMLAVARRTGYWPDDCQVIDHRHTGYLPKHEVLAVATGSQGEPKAALARMAKQNHPQVDLDAGDRVIFSTIVIPGNEEAVNNLVLRLEAMHVEVIQAQDSALPIHASGHPNEEELKLMYHWVQPKIAIPTHGEQEHLERHAQIAKEMKIHSQLLGRNGDLYQIAPQTMVKRGFVDAKRIAIKQPGPQERRDTRKTDKRKGNKDRDHSKLNDQQMNSW